MDSDDDFVDEYLDDEYNDDVPTNESKNEEQGLGTGYLGNEYPGNEDLSYVPDDEALQLALALSMSMSEQDGSSNKDEISNIKDEISKIKDKILNKEKQLETDGNKSEYMMKILPEEIELLENQLYELLEKEGLIDISLLYKYHFEYAEDKFDGERFINKKKLKELGGNLIQILNRTYSKTDKSEICNGDKILDVINEIFNKHKDEDWWVKRKFGRKRNKNIKKVRELGKKKGIFVIGKKGKKFLGITFNKNGKYSRKKNGMPNGKYYTIGQINKKKNRKTKFTELKKLVSMMNIKEVKKRYKNFYFGFARV